MLWRQNSRSPHCFGRTPTGAEPAWPEPCFVSVSDSNSQTCTADQFRQCDFAINVFNQSLLGHLYSILLWVYLILQFERFPLLPNTLNNCNFQTVDLHTKIMQCTLASPPVAANIMSEITLLYLLKKNISDRMTSAASALITTLAKTREQGDITLKCEGKDIKAHSFILKERYDHLNEFCRLVYKSSSQVRILQDS